MTTADGLVFGSVALQLLMWVRTKRVGSTSILNRLLDLLERLPLKTKIAITAVHVSAILLFAAPAEQNVIVLLKQAGSSSDAADARPLWNEAYREDMSSRTLPAAEGTWRPAR